MKLVVNMTAGERAKFFRNSRKILKEALGSRVSVVDGAVRQNRSASNPPLWFVVYRRAKRNWTARIRGGKVEYFAIVQ